MAPLGQDERSRRQQGGDSYHGAAARLVGVVVGAPALVEVGGEALAEGLVDVAEDEGLIAEVEAPSPAVDDVADVDEDAREAVSLIGVSMVVFEAPRSLGEAVIDLVQELARRLAARPDEAPLDGTAEEVEGTIR